MTSFSSILVPLDGSVIAAQSLGCATWLASRQGARLHILSATDQVLPAREELGRLHVHEEHWPMIALHQAPAFPTEAIMAAVARHEVQLVVISALGQAAEEQAKDSDPFKTIGHVARAVLEQSPVPVLLLPQGYRERLPWERALVPVSGDPEADAALALTVRLANDLGLQVHLAHVFPAQAMDEGFAAAARYADEPYYEYPGRLEELVSRALPQYTPEECRCIAELALCRGDITAELLRLMEVKRISLLVIGWHGRFMKGHARVLKHLIQVVSCPVLLVKPSPRFRSRLMVSGEIE